jgi:aspartokinase
MLYGIHAISRDDNIAVVYVRRPPANPAVAYMTFGALADGGVDVDIILQTASVGHGNDLIFTIHAEDSERAREILTKRFPTAPRPRSRSIRQR